VADVRKPCGSRGRFIDGLWVAELLDEQDLVGDSIVVETPYQPCEGTVEKASFTIDGDDNRQVRLPRRRVTLASIGSG
jgi:hypothetical protein